MAEPTDPRGTIEDQIAQAKIIKDSNILSVNRYRLLRDADEGTGGFEDGTYLAKHQRERDYAERRSYSAYFNYVKAILNARINPVFEKTPQREFKGANKEVWEEFAKDCDGRGTALTRFMKTVARKALRDKVAFIFMDASEYQPATLGEALEERTFPYLYIREAGRVVDWAIDRFGRLQEIVLWEYDTDGAVVYRRWKQDEWILYEDPDYKKEIERGPTPGFIPMIPFYSGEHDPEDVLPMPDLFAIAKANLAIYNISSEIRELQRAQGFSLLIYPIKKMAQGLIVGVKNVLNFDPEGKHAPAYISPSADIQKNFMAERNTYVLEIYRMAELMGVMGKMADSSGDESQETNKAGIAKEWDFKATNTVLADMAERCEEVEKAIAYMFGLFLGAEGAEVQVKYSREFGILDIMDELARADKALMLGIGGTFDLEVKKRLARAYFPEKDAEEMEEIFGELETHQEDADRDNEKMKQAEIEATAAKAEKPVPGSKK